MRNHFLLRTLRSFWRFMALVLSQRQLILSMTVRELAARYVGSLLGFAWTFIHPVVMIFVFWLVFSVGFRVTPMHNAPFVVWLTAGLSSWFCFVDIVNGSAVVVVANANLIKKTRFPSQILPLVRLLSCLATHLVFLLILVGLMAFQGVAFTFWNLQVIYYLACLCVLSLGLGWAVSALNVFLRDVSQIVAVLLQVAFWATPIFWDIDMMPMWIQRILKLNPMCYVVQGYRDTFIYGIGFWQRVSEGLYFWGLSLTLLVCGALIFKTLKPHFADVL